MNEVPVGKLNDEVLDFPTKYLTNNDGEAGLTPLKTFLAQNILYFRT
jgi:hypothetical protein